MIQRTTILYEQRFRVLWIPSGWTVFQIEGRVYRKVRGEWKARR